MGWGGVGVVKKQKEVEMNVYWNYILEVDFWEGRLYGTMCLNTY